MKKKILISLICAECGHGLHWHSNDSGCCYGLDLVTKCPCENDMVDVAYNQHDQLTAEVEKLKAENEQLKSFSMIEMLNKVNRLESENEKLKAEKAELVAMLTRTINYDIYTRTDKQVLDLEQEARALLSRIEGGK